MEKQSGFPARRTDSGLSAMLKVISKPTESSRQVRWQRRYDPRYSPQDNYKLRAAQKNPLDRRKYNNI